MSISHYILGKSSLRNAVVLNIIAVTIVGVIIEYLVSKDYFPKIEAARSIRDLGFISIYYVLVLPFDYIVWISANNAKNKFYLVLGKLFALKNLLLLSTVLFKFFSH